MNSALRALRLSLCLAAFAGIPTTPAGAEPDATFRVGFSRGVFSGVNENDARAALRVWGRAVARERGVPTDPDPQIFRSVAELRRSLEARGVDGIALQTTEYAELARLGRLGPSFVMRTAGGIPERYLLLAHRDAGVTSLAALRGRSLILHSNPRMCLAESWLSAMLTDQGLGALRQFSGRLTRHQRLSKAVLPVFFRQADACAVTESGFATMAELNPQVGRQLVVLARSPEYVPMSLCFRSDYAPAFRDALFDALRRLHESAAGQQVLTIFECERIVDAPSNWADSALELLSKHPAPAGDDGASGSAGTGRSASPATLVERTP